MRRKDKKSYVFANGAWALARTHSFKYHEWNPIEETISTVASINSQPSTVTSTKSYVWGNDLSGNLHGAGGVGGLLSMRIAGSAGGSPAASGNYFYAYDGNGNVRALVKADAANPAASAITARYAYDGFGKEVSVSGVDADKNAFRFSTKQLESETGMNYYGYRYYAADTGRWINRDPILEFGGYSLYCFIGNSAVIQWDKFGLKASCDECDSVCEKAKDIVGRGDAGGVVCCKGKPVACAWATGGTSPSSANKTAKEILIDCLLAHEKVHAGQYKENPCAGANDGMRPKSSAKNEKDFYQEEIDAHNVQLECLEAAKSKCDSDSNPERCKKQLKDELKYVKDQRNDYERKKNELSN